MSSISSSSSSLLLLGLHGRSKNTAGAEGQLTNAAQRYIGKLQNGKIFGSSSCTRSGVGECPRLATRSFAPHKMQIQCAVEGNEGHNSERTYLEERTSRRSLLMISLISLGSMVSDPASGKVKGRSPYDEKRLLEQNKRIQDANNAPEDFPNFVREGFAVKVVTPENYVKSDSGLFYLDVEVGKGDCPIDGQQVTFHYIGYNESGRRIDSTYLQGSPAKIRLGNKALVPGFEEGIRNMRPGGKRRIIIPPELGPPVGPSTFFSAKQFEVFDVELLTIKDCQRRTIGFYSDVVCE